MHILSPETDYCPSWISGREGMTAENSSWSISTKECCRPRRSSNPRPPGLQSDAHPTEPPRPALVMLKGMFKLHTNSKSIADWDAQKSDLELFSFIQRDCIAQRLFETTVVRRWMFWLIQRCINVIATLWRCIDVDTALYKRYVSTVWEDTFSDCAIHGWPLNSDDDNLVFNVPFNII